MKTSSEANLMERVKEMLLRSYERAKSVKAIEQGDVFDRFIGLREFYANANFEITQAGKAEWGIDPYEVNWLRVFTPIEFALWQDIRQEGVVLYPQYPIAGMFVDFANPVAKVVVECDGEAFHKNKAKDAARDTKLRGLGWTVYRISGRDCKSDFSKDTNEPGPARKLIRMLARDYEISTRFR